MSNNPNNPFNSQWNPNMPTTPNSFGNPYGYFNTQVPQTQFSQPRPDDYDDYMAWKNAQQYNESQETSFQDEVPTPTSRRRSSKGKEKMAAGDEPSGRKQKKVIPNQNSWDPVDELRLAQSWVMVSEDSNRGNALTGKTFWYLVMEEYNGRNPPFNRTKDALTSKWTKLNADCQKFGGIVSRLKNEWRSGENDNDFRTRCETQYRLENVKRFNSYLTWDFLKDKQKWLNPDPVVVGRRNRRREPEVQQTQHFDLNEDQFQANPNADLFADDPFPRPAGKSRKGKSQKVSSEDTPSSRESFERSVSQTFEGVSKKKESYYARKDLEAQIRILKVSTDDLPEVDRRAIERQKRKIRASMALEYPDSDSDS